MPFTSMHSYNMHVGRMLTNQGRGKEALGFLRTALAAKEGWIYARLNLAAALISTQDPAVLPSALTLLREFIAEYHWTYAQVWFMTLTQTVAFCCFDVLFIHLFAPAASIHGRVQWGPEFAGQ